MCFASTLTPMPATGILKSAVSPWPLLSDSALRWVSGPPRLTDARVHHLSASARTYKWISKPSEWESQSQTYFNDTSTHLYLVCSLHGFPLYERYYDLWYVIIDAF